MLRQRLWQPTTLAPEGPAQPQKALHTPWASVTSEKQPRSTYGISSNTRCCFYPQERFTAEPPNTVLRLVRCKVPTDLFSHKRAETAMALDFSGFSGFSG